MRCGRSDVIAAVVQAHSTNWADWPARKVITLKAWPCLKKVAVQLKAISISIAWHAPWLISRCWRVRQGTMHRDEETFAPAGAEGRSMPLDALTLFSVRSASLQPALLFTRNLLDA